MEKVDLRYNTPSRWTLFGPRISQARAHIILPMLVERASEGGQSRLENWQINSIFAFILRNVV